MKKTTIAMLLLVPFVFAAATIGYVMHVENSPLIWEEGWLYSLTSEQRGIIAEEFCIPIDEKLEIAEAYYHENNRVLAKKRIVSFSIPVLEGENRDKLLEYWKQPFSKAIMNSGGDGFNGKNAKNEEVRVLVTSKEVFFEKNVIRTDEFRDMAWERKPLGAPEPKMAREVQLLLMVYCDD